jgi:hypothetical protein
MAANKFSEILTAKVVGNKAIALSAKYTQAPFSVIGSSMTVSAQQHSIEDGTAQVTIYPQPDQDGIIAICALWDRQNAEPDTFYGFLSVTWKDKDGQKYPFVELEEMWSPSERIGHMQEDVITVQIRGETFYTAPSRAQTIGKRAHFVSEANLLCRYLVGTATASEVLHFATQACAEQSARSRLAQALQRNSELGGAVDRLELQAARHRTSAIALADFVRKLPRFMRPQKVNEIIAALSK